jgi:hypothetical protein
MTSSSKIGSGLIAAFCLLAPLSCVAQQWGGDKHERLRSFRVPESTATYPLSINDGRTVTGYYISNAGVTGGFVRSSDGQITTFNVPGSATTVPAGINTAGDITGYYQVATNNVLGSPQGFVRTPDGNITTFTGYTSNGLTPVSINVAGEIVGNFPDEAQGANIFLRSTSGVISTTTLSEGALYPTLVTGLNASGAIVGYDSSQSINVAQGFLWDGQGPLPSPVSSAGVTGIVVPGSTGTFPTALNADETVVGCYTVSGVYYDFVRDPDGTITTLNIPGTVPGCIASFNFPVEIVVVPQSITLNDEGTITGYYTNTAKASVGFVQFPDGKLITFSHPGSAQTIPTSINNGDVIAGYYSRGSEIVGFIRER